MTLLAFSALIIIFLEIFILGANFQRPLPTDFTEITSIPTSGGDISKFVANDGIFVLDDAAGRLSFYDFGGSQIFAHHHAISRGLLFANANFAAVSAHGGKVVNVYNSNGLVYSVITDAPISRFALGNAGNAAIAARDANGGFDIIFYDATGRPHHILHQAGEGILPVNMAFSPSDDVLVVSYVDVSGAVINSILSFVSISNQSGSFVGEIFAKNLYNPAQIVGYLNFTNANVLLAKSDAQIFAINPTNGQTLWNLPLATTAHTATFGDNSFAIACTSNGLKIYDISGQISLNLYKQNITNINFLSDNILIQSNNYLYAYELRTGRKLWQLQLPGQIEQAKFLTENNKIAILTPSAINILRVE